ncbi:hypothetical protein [Mycolicibacterium komossense]|uniref:Helix-turn-helix domain-containing protein n=1 Tax=Mycolicibacterium komossense TaxID=1779 RepID=A0ABT3C9I4_9MYCO|nr:hypothetical protein [Mycolicibacterium komossense]MCV7226086.1 hypothetical protein [Mycolicibacterium komossense]
MGRRNPIHVIGEPMRKGVTWISDELIRSAAHDDVLGADGFVAMAFLLSWAPASGSKRAWETSAAQLSEQFGWGANRRRATQALEAAVKDGRLLIREYIRDGEIVPRRCSYLVCAGGRRFTEEEHAQWSKAIELPSRLDPEC